MSRMPPAPFEVLTTPAAFRAASGGGRRAAVLAQLLADDLTPVSAFARLSAGQERAFLFESVVGGERIARYSFLGIAPERGISVRGGVATLHDHVSGGTRQQDGGDPLALLQELLGGAGGNPATHYADDLHAGLSAGPFLGGAVGYAGYDVARCYERLPNAPPDDRGLPDLLFDLYTAVVVFDHVRKSVLLVAYAPGRGDGGQAHGGRGGGPDEQYAEAVARLAELASRLQTPALLRPLRAGRPNPLERFTSNFTRPRFEQAVAACQEYIRAGDVFQVVLSQRLTVDTPAAPFDIYRALRFVNPSPYMFFLKTPAVTLVGASPEIMCRVQDGVVTNRPLAGTRPRGADAAADAQLRAELLADPKERAEHIMLVDLARNDVGRVARPGSVRVDSEMAVEFYSHVMHISSSVSGRLAAQRSAFDALRAALPVGTVSGAPKVRAMEIIDEFEPTRRGPYGGAVGYVDFNGNMDTCIALRTLVMQPAGERGAGWRAWAQAGAGIVADSDAAREYEETLNKAAGLLAAIALVEQSG